LVSQISQVRLAATEVFMALGSSVFRGRKREAIPLKVSPVATEFTAAYSAAAETCVQGLFKGGDIGDSDFGGGYTHNKTMADMKIVHMEQLAISYC
jgi:hypothetical protein